MARLSPQDARRARSAGPHRLLQRLRAQGSRRPRGVARHLAFATPAQEWIAKQYNRPRAQLVHYLMAPGLYLKN